MFTLNGVSNTETRSTLTSCKKIEYVYVALVYTSLLTIFREGGDTRTRAHEGTV